MRALLEPPSFFGVIYVSLRIRDALMTSSVTGHAARRTTGTTTWSVSWLGDRQLTRNQAITALTLAELIAAGVFSSAHKQWPEVVSFAAELGLAAETAVYLIKEKT